MTLPDLILLAHSGTVTGTMLMIRFQRIGRKNDPAFRIAVLEKTSGPRTGKFIDLVGTYNPKTKATRIHADSIKEWVSKGAQVSPSLHNLLIAQGIITGTKAAVVSRKNLEKNKGKNEAAVEAVATTPETSELPTEGEVIAEELPLAEEETAEEAVAAEEIPTTEAAETA